MPSAGDATRTIRVVIADDDPDIRVLLRTLLELDPRLEVVGEAGDGGEALTRFEELHPDVLVLDERMPAMYGLEVAERVLAVNPDQAVILCTAYVDDAVLAGAAARGVHCVLGKNEIQRIGEEILRAMG